MNRKYINSNLIQNDDETHFLNKKNFVVGIIILILAFVGIAIVCVSLINIGIQKSQKNKENEINSYNSFLVPVCAVDPSSFDDITSADMSELIEISVWSIIGSDSSPDKYDYSSGELAIPQTDIESAYITYFGNTVPIVHQTVEGYGYRFEYSEDDCCYYIPLTGITPVYTPSVISVEEKNGLITITCGMLYSGAWQQDYETGTMVVPDPDKYITVTIRSKSDGDYICSIGQLGSVS